MNKELGALENFVRMSVWNDDEFHEIWDNGNYDLEIVKQALLELKAIKESKPSEALEYLKKNNELFDEIALENPTTYKEGTVIEAYVYHCNSIGEDKVKAFDLINEKRVDIKTLHWVYPNVEAYNVWVRENNKTFWRKELTPEEFEFIGRLAGAK